MSAKKEIKPPKHDYTSTQRAKKRTEQDNLWAYVVSKGKYNTLRKLMTAINKGEIILVAVEKITPANKACTGRGLQPPAKQVESTAEVKSPAKARGKHQPRQ